MSNVLRVPANLAFAFALAALAGPAAAQLVVQNPVAQNPVAQNPVAQNPLAVQQQVQQLAPQLLPFSGSPANFQNLVNGLSAGTPITLTTLGADGFTRSIAFTPPGGLSALDIARTLEAARQQLITQGVGAPSGEQIGVTLMGGALATPAGTRNVAGLLPGTAAQGTVSPAAPAVQGSAAAGASVPSINTSASPFFGTSNSPVIGTSNSPVIGTSNSPVIGTSNTPTLPNATTQLPPGAAMDASRLVRGAAVNTRAGTIVQPRLGASASPAAGASLGAGAAPNGPASPAAQIQGRR